jgi:hypothetical protein
MRREKRGRERGRGRWRRVLALRRECDPRKRLSNKDEHRRNKGTKTTHIYGLTMDL